MGASERPIVLTLARLDRQKGLYYLLEAAALVPEAVFVLAGEGPEWPALEAQARALGLTKRVILLGYRDDVSDLLASCDVFVLPSLFEGLPLSVLEAMAAGKPVVATAIGGTDEAVVDGVTGLLVPPADPAALAKGIRMVLSDPVLSARLGAAGRARAHEQFSAEAMVRRVSDVYDELLDSRQAPQSRD
jgi:glycosyltransferase involved in cell wall biosynthesis